MDRKLVVAGVAMLALVPAGCGSSSKPLTRAQFAQQANAICTKRKAVITSAGAKHNGDLRGAIRQALPTLETSVKQLSALRPPAELKSAYTEIMAVEHRNIGIAKEALAGKLPRGEEVGAPLHHNEELRMQLGMPACN